MHSNLTRPLAVTGVTRPRESPSVEAAETGPLLSGPMPQPPPRIADPLPLGRITHQAADD